MWSRGDGSWKRKGTMLGGLRGALVAGAACTEHEDPRPITKPGTGSGATRKSPGSARVPELTVYAVNGRIRSRNP